MTAGPALRSDTLALSRATVDRADHRRGDEAWLARARKDPTSRVLVIGAGRVHVTGDDAPELVLLPPDQVPTGPIPPGADTEGGAPEPGNSRPGEGGSVGAPDPSEWYLLGEEADVAYFAAVLPVLPSPSVEGATPTSLRLVGDILSDRDAGLFVHAEGLARWHEANVYCSRCGEATLPERAGHVRRCPACGTEHFPRTDPAVIMLVRDAEDRALLGSQGQWGKDRYSVLAGFVEPGESLEAAVIREVAEEAGIAVHDVTYLASQPWPFPCSLMLGFFARAAGDEIHADGEELTDVRWFSRDELAARLRAGTIRLPPRVSIARRLIETWYGGPLPGPTGW